MVKHLPNSWILVVGLVAAIIACSDDSSTTQTQDSSGVPSTEGDYIFVSSASVFGGLTITPLPASNTVVRYATDGTFDRVIVDYTNSPGDQPVAIVNFDDDNLLVLVENGAGRRIDIAAKDGSGWSTYLTNASALNGFLRSIAMTSDGSLLVSKTTAIEKFSSSKSRVTSGVNSYVQAQGGSCTTPTMNATWVGVGPSDTILFANAAVSTSNKIDQIKATGYSTATDCLVGKSAPTVAHIPTTGLYHSSGKLLIGFSNNGGPTHQIYSYDVSATTITGGTAAFTDTGVINGISAIAELPDGTVLVGNAAPAFNNIEKFTFDETLGTLTRVGTSAFIPASVFTRAISGIVVGHANQ